MVSHSLPQNVRRQKRNAAPEGMAYCSVCDQYKTTREFSVDTKQKSGLNFRCKICQSEYAKSYYNRPGRKEKIADYAKRPEVKERRAAYHKTPEAKAKRAIYSASPERRARKAEWSASQEQIAKRAAYANSPEAKKKRAIYNASPERKMRVRERQSSPEYKAKQAQYRSDPENKIKKTFYIRHKKYGITKQEYDKLLEQQNGACAICGNPETKTHKGVKLDLCVDHDHETGEIRGLLCKACNTALGLFRDNIENLSNAIDYLMGLNR